MFTSLKKGLRKKSSIQSVHLPQGESKKKSSIQSIHLPQGESKKNSSVQYVHLSQERSKKKSSVQSVHLPQRESKKNSSVQSVHLSQEGSKKKIICSVCSPLSGRVVEKNHLFSLFTSIREEPKISSCLWWHWYQGIAEVWLLLLATTYWHQGIAEVWSLDC